jgi:hypothetical protein
MMANDRPRFRWKEAKVYQVETDKLRYPSENIMRPGTSISPWFILKININN